MGRSARVGASVGDRDGDRDGARVGDRDGAWDGVNDGDRDGTRVGELVPFEDLVPGLRVGEGVCGLASVFERRRQTRATAVAKSENFMIMERS